MNLITWIAVMVELIALVLLGRKLKIGFIVNALSAILWIMVGTLTGLYALSAMCTITFVINLLNYRRWSL